MTDNVVVETCAFIGAFVFIDKLGFNFPIFIISAFYEFAVLINLFLVQSSLIVIMPYAVGLAARIGYYMNYGSRIIIFIKNGFFGLSSIIVGRSMQDTFYVIEIRPSI